MVNCDAQGLDVCEMVTNHCRCDLICTFCPIVALYEAENGSIIVVIAIEDGISSVEGHGQTVSRFGATSQSCPHEVFVAGRLCTVSSS